MALDVRSHAEAERLVDALDNVSLFKIGLRLFLAGDLYGLVRRIQGQRRGGIFVDLKMAGDISNTITDFVDHASELGIRFITLAESRDDVFTRHSLAAGRKARGGDAFPQFLMVPLLSSLTPANFGRPEVSAEDYIVDRGREMVAAGCDGLIVSGDAIGACRKAFGRDVTLVSPGIRPGWAEADDHQRLTTPAHAIRLGADYLVVGRPIREAQNPRDAAQRVIDEIEEELARALPLGRLAVPRGTS
ncbi:MAG: orotidine-5'-phosphate decarboxylase [Acidobacteria bacterium]|nr:orotidine-5'-phosphate decarboxylase [Acidobacteriota bacterium]